ncbi:NAD-aldehyde dehydrogenase [Exidia glandulosa HHB12029]|uniref:aldehyde dehydrogenase (NAD(+)) n=1 Tax=Exidia glandulosa HHB12029 TaxID=1314781 RepID=A0A165K8Z8_EXIGL|nr:NAD-aldehyde dehydrogenase [Exidia glandulosa HHB12029]
MFLRATRPLFPAARRLSTRASQVLSSLGINHAEPVPGVYDGQWRGSGEHLLSVCPATGEELARVVSASPEELHTTLDKAREAYKAFRLVPAPRRGEVLRQIREEKADLGALVSLEMGKIRSEGAGEVQEIVDILDYGVGLSRMMNGRVVASERPGHSILEIPNPLGVVAVLSAFNFPVAVYGWNLALSFAAGNATIWKPSQTTPLCSIALTKIISEVLERNELPGVLAALVTGAKDVGSAIVESKSVDMVSFTGSEAVGRQVAKTVQSRFGKVLLELGGNNASIIMPDADLSLAVPAVFFGAVGTAGQRCTSTRRLYLHRTIAPEVLSRLETLYASVPPKIGDPLLENTLLGPLHNENAVQIYERALETHKAQHAEILTSSGRYTQLAEGNFVLPVIAVPKHADPGLAGSMWSTETFAPILSVAVFDELEQAIEWNNAVPQGLSSSLWTRDVRHIGQWLGPAGSDTGIVNVNVGTSGAEIGAAFGGNKSTGWGRESGGDAWKQYVRWSAATINFSDAAPLAQGVSFAP